MRTDTGPGEGRQRKNKATQRRRENAAKEEEKENGYPEK